MNPLLASPGARNHFAEFLTAELSETLKLESSQRKAVLVYLKKRLASGATFSDAMKALAESALASVPEIKAMLSPSQQQLFDQVYGADGVLLFSYARAVALRKIGP